MVEHFDDRELDDLLAEGRGLIDDELDEVRRFVGPDFAAVVALAHERDPDAVPAQAIADVEGLAPVVEFKAHSASNRFDGDALLADDLLDALVAEARADAENDVAARRLAGIPAMRRAEPSEAGKRWLGPVLALAAVIVAALVLGPRLFEALVDGARVDAEPRDAAEYIERGEDGEGRAQESSPRFERAALEHDTAMLAPVDSAPRGEHVVGDDAKSDASKTPAIRTSTKREGDKGDQISTLDAEAQELWAQGDLIGAEARFRKIIELAGKSRHADLAYGDLFTLARQRGDDQAQQDLWREYVARFPKGRFADDARAG
ncbi:MAG: hypothetical protein KC431_06880, partial [Myxococcales bacterium]|nr:hypothetical protein [Myxococcales bacterium]